MPRFDVTAAKAEIDAGREPVELVMGGNVYNFPGAMPAEVEIVQMQLAREVRDLDDNAEAQDQSERMMRACFGDQYEAIERDVGMIERLIGMGRLMQYWSEPYQDPNRMAALMERVSNRNSNSASSSTSAPSKPTSSGSTGSISPARSSSNGFRGAASSRSTAASAASR